MRGAYDPNIAAHDMTLRIDHFLGRGRITVERGPVPMNYAYGLRSALQAALARVEADIVEGGGELD